MRKVSAGCETDELVLIMGNLNAKLGDVNISGMVDTSRAEASE